MVKWNTFLFFDFGFEVKVVVSEVDAFFSQFGIAEGSSFNQMQSPVLWVSTSRLADWN